MELILLALLEEPAFWSYVFPLNLLCGMLLPAGAGFQMLLLRKKKRWFFLPLVLLVLCAACEGLCLSIGTFEAFLFVFIGVPAYMAFAGTLAGTLLYKLWTKVRHF